MVVVLVVYGERDGLLCCMVKGVSGCGFVMTMLYDVIRVCDSFQVQDDDVED